MEYTCRLYFEAVDTFCDIGDVSDWPRTFDAQTLNILMSMSMALVT